MASPPARTEISDNYPLPSDATARIGFGKLYDYVTGLLGATGNALEARAALGAYGKNNVLGTVSQSAGVPTGAVIERGSNANGEYVRFADGTQICTKTITSSASASVAWTYSSSFSIAPMVEATIDIDTPGICSTQDRNTATCSFNAWNLSSARISAAVWVVAVGRWF